ncbi:pimeloyl-ACP methyl ester carboxylesterase [Aeromicrobium panaciterrae]|uniref:Pimeloyl-ACP methyl ester carboxylesterase n=1 Tax=Aeromicrobium panaciterrae TaxID=363861 RepID=A0ABU1UJH3_9ACTN|nr:alpha/beta hydrolase [Aeromicrobium panaciterrae]MDR7085313.1 pimeloyl-ACP methyl ester carboxylesterase [Aeromicrobium panaciterrae]
MTHTLGAAAGVATRLTGSAARSGMRVAVRRSGKVPDRSPLPPGTMINLEGRGETCVVDTGEPFPGAPTVLLLHGIATTASLCWFTTVDELRADHRVVLMDQRWHGRGLPADRFSLNECADDIDALLTTLDIEQVVVVGYSMGGALAQVLVRRHPGRISGLMLCSTAPTWKGNKAEALFYPVLGAITAISRRHTSSKVRSKADSLPPLSEIEQDDVMQWAWSEFRATSFWSLPEVLAELGRFDARKDLASVTVPSAVVVTSEDKVIPAERQLEMAALIPGAKTFMASGGHASVVLDSENWRPVFLEALADVTARIARKKPKADVLKTRLGA